MTTERGATLMPGGEEGMKTERGATLRPGGEEGSWRLWATCPYLVQPAKWHETCAFDSYHTVTTQLPHSYHTVTTRKTQCFHTHA